DRRAGTAHFEVEVRAGRAASRTRFADDVAGLYFLAFLHVDTAQVRVARGEAVAMVDLDHAAVAAVEASADDLAGAGAAYRHADRRAEVDAGVHRRAADQRVAAYAEAAGDCLARNRMMYRQMHGRS